MQIGITNALRTFLHLKPFAQNGECDPFFCWDASREIVDGRVMLVLFNVANRFCCVSAMRGSDWKRLEDYCGELVHRGLMSMGFSASAADEYLKQGSRIEFGRTHGRKALGCMNQAILYLTYCDCDHHHQFQEKLTRLANEEICHCATREDYGYPKTWMEEDMRAHGIEPYEAQIPAPSATPRCMVCGKEARVFVGNEAYCLDCHNNVVEHELGIEHVEHDSSTLVAFDQSGRVVQFGVERMLLPHLASWTAREMVEGGASRRGSRYEGIEVTTYAEPDEDSDETLVRLNSKVQEILENPSTKSEKCSPGMRISNGVHRGDEAVFANESGWGRISYDERDGYCIVIDGWRYTGDEFIQMLTCYEGFNLHWRISDNGEFLDG